MARLRAFRSVCFAWVATALVASPSHASGYGHEQKRFYFGAGALAYNMGHYANQVSGQTALEAYILPDLSLMGRFGLGSGAWSLSPQLSFTPLGHGSPDGGESTRILRIEGRVLRSIRILDLQLGVGLLNAIVSGSGGTINLNNGNGMTTFGIPADSSMASLFYWEAGLGAELTSSFRLEGSFFVTGAASSSRAYNLSTFLSYGFL
jgi:hypothetical protein